MCGICGIVEIDGSAASDERPRRQMIDSLRHRGPDSEGFFTAHGIWIGVSRLSIVDRKRGDQPFISDRGSLAVVHNGEIYNHRRLRHQLQKRGYHFRSRCDTEVILHAFQEWGEEALSHLRGMFSLAVAARRSATGRDGFPFLLLARDLAGIKPLYYYRDGSRLLFASELRALLASGLVPRRLSPSGLVSYLRTGSVLEPDSIVEGIRLLPPGHYLVVREGKLEVKPFGELRAEATDLCGRPLQSAVRQWLEEAVKEQLEGDQAPAVFLSGGLDSAVVAAFAARHYPSTLRTLSLSFSESEFDEAPEAAETAAFLGTSHCSIPVSQSEVLKDLDQILHDMDQPTIDGVNTWWIAREARRRGIRTALSGLGGDELFAGYPTFWGARSWRRTRMVLEGIPEALRRSGYRGLTFMGGRSRHWSRLPELLNVSPFSHPYFLRRTLFGPAQTRTLLKGLDPAPGSDLQARMDRCTRKASRLDPIGEVTYLELTHYTLNRLLRDTDSMSMAHGVEVRVPLLDHPLIAKMLGVDGDLKWKSGKNKPLLRDACREVLPPRFRQQRKQTFTFPWEVWLRGPLGRTVGASLGKTDAADILHYSEIQRVWHDFLGGRQNWARPWSLFVLKQWIERNL